MMDMKLRMKLICMTIKMCMIYKNYGKEKYGIDIIFVMRIIKLMIHMINFNIVRKKITL